MCHVWGVDQDALRGRRTPVILLVSVRGVGAGLRSVSGKPDLLLTAAAPQRGQRYYRKRRRGSPFT